MSSLEISNDTNNILQRCNKKSITLVAADNSEIEVETKVVKGSQMITDMINKQGDNCSKIPLHTIKKNVLKKVIEFLNYHADIKKPYPIIMTPLQNSDLTKLTPSLDQWDINYINCNQEMLYELILAANILNISSLMQLCAARVASMMKGKTADQIRNTFNIKNDFTPDEIAIMEEENKWTNE